MVGLYAHRALPAAKCTYLQKECNDVRFDINIFSILKDMLFASSTQECRNMIIRESNATASKNCCSESTSSPARARTAQKADVIPLRRELASHLRQLEQQLKRSKESLANAQQTHVAAPEEIQRSNNSPKCAIYLNSSLQSLHIRFENFLRRLSSEGDNIDINPNDSKFNEMRQLILDTFCTLGFMKKRSLVPKQQQQQQQERQKPASVQDESRCPRNLIEALSECLTCSTVEIIKRIYERGLRSKCVRGLRESKIIPRIDRTKNRTPCWF